MPPSSSLYGPIRAVIPPSRAISQERVKLPRPAACCAVVGTAAAAAAAHQLFRVALKLICS